MEKESSEYPWYFLRSSHEKKTIKALHFTAMVKHTCAINIYIFLKVAFLMMKQHSD